MMEFITPVNTSIASKNGRQLARLLKQTFPLYYAPLRHTKNNNKPWISNPITFFENKIAPAYLPIVANVLIASKKIEENNWDEAYTAELDAYNCMLTAFKEDSTNWLIPLLNVLSNDLRMIAIQADTSTKKRDNEYLRDALRNLTNGFNTVAKERTPYSHTDSKKLAIFSVTIVLFKIYFKLNTLQLCSKLVNVVERPGPGNALEYESSFPVSDVVTYKFYIGKLKVFEDKYEDARDCFMFCLRKLPEDQYRNKQRILLNLVPIQMSLGIMPSKSIGEKYGLGQFCVLANAVVTGNLKLFETILQENEKTFIKAGIYFVLEQVKLLLYRNLLKRIYGIVANTRIKLTDIARILSWMNQDCIFDEVECILANLIYHGKIKGYIAHKNQLLILSKQDPFPLMNILKRLS